MSRIPWCRRLWQVAVLACLVALTACTVQAKDIYVNNQTGQDGNNGSSESPVKTIRKALMLVGEGDVIHLQPEGSVYREMVTLKDVKNFTIEGNKCTVTGADPLPSDPAKWEQVSEGLHRIKLKRTTQDRAILVVNGKAQMMGRTKYQINAIGNLERKSGFDAYKAALMKQYPAPAELKDGEFSWEPIDKESGWLYVKGSLDNLEWSIRQQGIYTTGNVSDVTIRNLKACHALNDGWNVHGNAQNLKLYNIIGNECFDNGISPHGACSYSVEDGEFLRNEMAVGDDFLTETSYLRCTFGDSYQEEYMTLGGKHTFDDCKIVSSGKETAVKLVYSKPGGGRSMALKEIEASGKDINMKPENIFRNCTIESVGGQTRDLVIGAGQNATFENCTFKAIRFKVDPGANVSVTNCTLDGQPLTEAMVKGK